MGLAGRRHAWWLGLCMAAGCASDPQARGSAGNPLTEGSEFEEEPSTPGEGDEGPDDPENLDCPRGGDTGPITVLTCKDLSNVVLELDDGTHHKIEGLHGKRNDFQSPEEHVIVGVWVKSGANHSGDGPGYGERFDAPANQCSEDDEPPVNAPPSSEDPPSPGSDEPSEDEPPAQDDPIVE
jgi:hypothetical protein